MASQPSDHDRIRGCLVGGAVGDALGYQVEFDAFEDITDHWGDAGVTELRSNQVSDDTQMTLFTVEGLLDAKPTTEVESVREAYLRWYNTQKTPMPPARARGLAAESWLYVRRAPGNACLSGLAAGGGPGVNPNSKGCGTVMRSAPFGLLDRPPAECYALAAECSALTHGHPTAGESAGALAMIVNLLMRGIAPREAVSQTLLYLRRSLDRSETADALRKAFALAGETAPAPGTCAPLGEGWIAEEALAIAVYCLLGTGPDRVSAERLATDVRAALIASVSHSGDSDSTGAICGNLLGAAYGYGTLPREWTTQVEGRATIEHLADQLAASRR
jgi:ADP-ribosylglycohydrolase